MLRKSFDKLETLLSGQRYVAGDQFTLSDIRLFVTLLRFDPVYIVYFKTKRHESSRISRQISKVARAGQCALYSLCTAKSF